MNYHCYLMDTCKIMRNVYIYVLLKKKIVFCEYVTRGFVLFFSSSGIFVHFIVFLMY